MWFFTSPLYQEKILGRKPITVVEESGKQETPDSAAVDQGRGRENSVAEEQVEPPMPATAHRDTPGVDIRQGDVVGSADTVQWDSIVVETDKIICKITERGGRIVSLRTKEYAYREGMGGNNGGDSLIDMLPREHGPGGANLAIGKQKFDGRLFELEGEHERVRITGPEKASVRLVCTMEDGRSVVKTFTFRGDSYRVDHSVESSLLPGRRVAVGWLAGIRESESGGDSRQARYDKRTVHIFDGKDPERITLKEPGEEERTGFYKWVGLTSKYFLVAQVADTIHDFDVSIYSWTDTTRGGEDDKKSKLNYGFTMRAVPDESRMDYWFYAF